MIAEKASTYIKQKTLTVTGRNWAPNLDNIVCYFDGRVVTLTPTDGTSAGTTAGSVKSKNDGTLSATFMIPAGVLTGIREVKLVSNIAVDNHVTSGFALYQATGLDRTYRETIETTTTVLVSRTITNVQYNSDPVAQTFMVDQTTILTGVDLFFEARPAEDVPIQVQIKTVVNGMPTSTIIGQGNLSVTQVNVSANASAATRFVLDDPVVLEPGKEYAFVIVTASDTLS